jgi:hypothetical protein
MTGSRLFAALAASLLLVWGAADAAVKADKSFRFPAGKAARIIVLRPDVKVGSLGAGGVEEPNADWTAAARTKLAERLDANQKASGNQIIFLPDQEGDKAQVVADYQALFRTVSGALVQHKMFPGAGLPTKKDRFDWTLGPGAAKLGEIGGGDYALFFSTRDAYGTSGRKALQLFAAMAGVGIQAGIHQSYAGLVDLSTGQIVWFNVDPASGGDVRTDEGATKRVGQLLKGFPGQDGAPAKVAAK